MLSRPLFLGEVAQAQVYIGDLSPTAYQSADPYQMVAPQSSGLLGVLQAGGAPMITLNEPIVAEPILAEPIVGLPTTAAPVSQPILGRRLLPNWQPIFPQVRDGINDRLYLSGEYLLWDVSGMDIPALVTTSPTGTAQASAGVLGEATTSNVFGPGEINDGTVGGFRVGGGFWVTPLRNVAIESEYFQLGEMDDGYSGSSTGSPIIARPFFDVVNGRENAQLVAFPGLAEGSLGVSTQSKLRSFLINARLCLCSHGANCQQCGMRDRTDWIIGYRNVRLRDRIDFGESIDSQNGNITLADSFRTTNQFNGLQLGIVRRSLLRRRSWLETMMRVAIGNNQQELLVDGSTTFTENGVTDTVSGGLYALRSNIGNFERDEFVMIPELGVRLGVRLRERLHMTVGYSVMYFPNVIRAGEQIDTDINPNLVPDVVDPVVGALRPRVLWIESDYLAHGLSFAGELHF